MIDIRVVGVVSIAEIRAWMADMPEFDRIADRMSSVPMRGDFGRFHHGAARVRRFLMGGRLRSWSLCASNRAVDRGRNDVFRALSERRNLPFCAVRCRIAGSLTNTDRKTRLLRISWLRSRCALILSDTSTYTHSSGRHDRDVRSRTEQPPNGGIACVRQYTPRSD